MTKKLYLWIPIIGLHTGWFGNFDTKDMLHIFIASIWQGMWLCIFVCQIFL